MKNEKLLLKTYFCSDVEQMAISRPYINGVIYW